MNTPKFYAGIGARRTPPEICAMMSRIARVMVRQGWTLRSGGARGADQAFEHGCDQAQGPKEIYLPWNGFEGRSSRVEPGVISKVTPEAQHLASLFHPNWAACSPVTKQLMGRNSHQLFGADLLTPVTSILCWTPNAEIVGGTGQALRMAKAYGIQVINLANPHTHFEWSLALNQEEKSHGL